MISHNNARWVTIVGALEQCHHRDVITSAIASQITSLTIAYLIVYSGADQEKSKLRVTGLCGGNSKEAGDFLAQWASSAKNVSI